ncbi:hypothetical protein REPUB_Repub15cG0134800 [Reevesia pubescens]
MAEAVLSAVVEGVVSRQTKNSSVKLWLEKLNGVAYDADDVLDEFDYEILRRKVEIGSQKRRKVRNFLSPSNPIAFCLKMANKIKGIHKSLDELNKLANQFGLQQKAIDITPVFGGSIEETVSVLDDSKIVGRKNDVSKVIDLLINSNADQQVVSLVPIVGMAGLGKNTLAKLVYNDVQVTRHFDVKFWICMSDDFDVKGILKYYGCDKLSEIGDGLSTSSTCLKVLWLEKCPNLSSIPDLEGFSSLQSLCVRSCDKLESSKILLFEMVSFGSDKRFSFLARDKKFLISVIDNWSVKAIQRKTTGTGRVIANSVSQLNPSEVLKLLQSLVSIIQSRGAVLACALPWIKSLLLQHASGIMSLESSLLALNSLYQLIESRVSTFESVLQISSCLDLLYAEVCVILKSVAGENFADAMETDDEKSEDGEALDEAFDGVSDFEGIDDYDL